MAGLVRKSILVVCALVFVDQAMADPFSESRAQIEPKTQIGKFSGDWKLEVGGADHSEGNDEAGLAMVGAAARFNFQLTDWLKIYAAPFADFASGRVQERFDDEYFNAVGAREAYVSATPLSFVDIRGGIIGQRFLDLPQLISSRRAFPGAQEILTYQGPGSFKAQLIGQQLLPTSISFNTDRQDKEKMPSFQTQSVHLSDRPFDWLEWSAMAGHYQWNALPSKVALQSQIEGNSVDGEITPDSRFRYGFNGFFWGTDLVFGQPTQLQPVLSYQGLTNTLAPSAARDAQNWGVGAKIRVAQVDYRAIYHRYFTEPDATVAAYGMSRYGNNNRIGDDIEVRVDFLQYKFALYGEYVNARTINASSTQDTWNFFKISLETHYATMF